MSYFNLNIEVKNDNIPIGWTKVYLVEKIIIISRIIAQKNIVS